MSTKPYYSLTIRNSLTAAIKKRFENNIQYTVLEKNTQKMHACFISYYININSSLSNKPGKPSRLLKIADLWTHNRGKPLEKSEVLNNINNTIQAVWL